MSEDRIQQLEDALQRFVNLFFVNPPKEGSPFRETILQAKAVLAGESITKPLRNDKCRLQDQLSHIMQEDRVIMGIIEASCAHEREADYQSECKNYDDSSYESGLARDLDNLLEEHKITQEVDQEDGEILHLFRDGKPWRDFHLTEWVWTNEKGEWFWENAC